MAKNFASVLDSLRAAGEDRLQEVDSVYTLNCDWLLEHFKLSQTSLAALRPTSHATINDVEEQQSTAKAHGRRSQQKSTSANTATETVQQKQISGAEARSSEHDASPAEPLAAPLPRVLRSRRGQANAAPASSAQGSAANKQFPSPPKTRAGRKRNQAATKSAAVSASTRRGMKAAHQQAKASDEPEAAHHQEVHAHQQSVDTEAISLPKPPHSDDVQKVHSPGPVLATSDSLQQEVQIGPNSHFTQEIRPSAEAPSDSPTGPAEVLPKLIAEEQLHATELAGASMSKRRKRKQSAMGESLLASDSKRWHTSTAKLRQPDSPVAGSPAVEHEQGAALQAASDPNDRDDDVKEDQPQESLTLADSMDASSPPVTDQPAASPVVHPQPSVVSPVEPVLESSPAPAADANTVVAASPVNARNSDYQDAQERLSSPLCASPAPGRSQGEQPAEPSVHMLHEDVDQAAAAASPSPPDSPEDQVAQASGHSPVALNEAQASPAHVATDPEPDTSVAAAGVELACSAALPDVPDADSNTALQMSAASALGAAAAVPLPASAGTQGDGPDTQPSSSDAAAANGLAGNLVSAIRSFLPGAKPPEPHLAQAKKPVKVKALEAADAARRKEAAKNADRIKQKGTLDKQRAERGKAKQEEEQQKAQEDAKKRHEAIRKREEEAAQRRRAKEEAERKERQERQAKAEAFRAKKKADEVRKKEPERTVPRQAEAQSSRAPLQIQSSNVQAPAMAQAVLASSKPVHQPAGPSIARLPLHQQLQVPSGLAQASAPSMPTAPAALQPAAPQQLQAQPAAAAPQTQGRQIAKPGVPEADTYQISPYRGDESDAESSEDDDPKKPIPEWARGRALMQQLASQVQTDPDEVFQQHRKTCSLDEVFGHSDSDKNNKQKKDLSRRSSSGNWIEDRVTWKEELNYKKAMGYM